MAFGSTPKDSGNIPISSAYVPGVGFVAVQGSANTNTDASSNQSTAVLTALAASNAGSGTLQNSQTGSANGTALSVLGYAGVAFTVNMAGFTGTVTFKGSEDGTNYDNINAIQAGTNTIGNTAVGSTTTSIHIYFAECVGLQLVEAVTSGVSAGNVTVTAHALPVNLAPRVVNSVLYGTVTTSGDTAVAVNASGVVKTLSQASSGTNLGVVQLSKSNATVAANTASNTVVKNAAAYLCSVVVTTLGTAALSFYDNATTNSGTVLLTIPASAAVGTIYTLYGAAASGIVAAGVTNCPGLTVYYV